jgi:hypothetical protein
MIWVIALVLLGVLAAIAAGVAFVLVATGRLTLDTGLGRRTRQLGPQLVRIRAPREMVFDLVAVPYLSKNPPRALREKVEVLDRGADLVLAAHRTQAGRLTAVTVETVSFDRPERIGFRLVRGPVPFVAESFTLNEVDDGAATELVYLGEMGTDGWGLGALWGRVVARLWERAVEGSLEGLKASAEDMAQRRGARPEAARRSTPQPTTRDSG